MALPTTVSEATRRLNPHLFGGTPRASAAEVPAPRIKQARAPKLTAIENRVLFDVTRRHCTDDVRPHALTLELANGCKYTPDVVAVPRAAGGSITVFEAKGKKSWDDAIVKLKVAARVWPCITFFLVDEVSGALRYERVLP